MFIYFIFLLISKITLSKLNCIEGKNKCLKCNPITKLCIKCEKDVYVPDNNGGCENSKKCKLGFNHCYECNDKGDLCKICEEGYIPDENGGCTYTLNCEISYRGICLKCKDNFILIGDDKYLSNEIKICKSIFSEDLQNCQTINMDNGVCEKCEEGYFLTKNDKKCNKIQNCYSSKNGECTKCIDWYYLDRSEQKCKEQYGIFFYCKESFDGKKCDKCNDDYYFDKYNICTATNYCLTADQGLCEKCIEGYYLSKENNYCTSTKNCFYGNKDFGICYYCNDNYFFDYNDLQCKSNQENNEFKYCELSKGKCYQCLIDYFLGEDNKCSTSRHCQISENGVCKKCLNGYHLGLDNICTNIEKCIYSNPDPDIEDCYECEDNYFYNLKNKKCEKSEKIFENCKRGDEEFYCFACKNDFYINQTDHLCYLNNDTNLTGGFYKCAETDSLAEGCVRCIGGYFLGKKDHNCSKIEGCLISENINKCIECDDDYCYDEKTGRCEINDKIINEEKKFYYRCNISNKDGNGCEICNEGYTLDKNGICVDNKHCVEKSEDEICKKCQNDNDGTYCVNKYFGCEIIFSDYNCLECNDIYDFNRCTKCFDGYELNENNECFEIK